MSLIAVGWNIFNAAWRDRAKLSLEVNLHVLGLVGHTVTCVGVKAMNKGRRPLTLTWCNFDTGNGNKLSYSPGLAFKDPILGPTVDDSFRMPRRLEEGERHTFYFPEMVIQDAVREDSTIVLKKAIVYDGTEKEWSEEVPEAIRANFTHSTSIGSEEASAEGTRK